MDITHNNVSNYFYALGTSVTSSKRLWKSTEINNCFLSISFFFLKFKNYLFFTIKVIYGTICRHTLKKNVDITENNFEQGCQ